ncbi:MAG: hypothetical protein AVDCRST_MAG68-844 [uncultured Gemmatimonadetes bacterium]|uniref:Uncharacterized protein n=1 Tax=uncultured Gemmatimonadota bacterium TaxID=203437 RepID=A0A6J4KHK4_9BACT|nr:MAG: hypothetical protein AVDCRST_MAG68-844 [uncultured Gemmatimonadota bacterium]
MPYGRGYDRHYDRGFRGGPRGYDRGGPRARYDRAFGRPDPGFGPMAFTPFPFVPFGYDPMMGPMSWPLPYGAEMGGARPGFRYDRDHRVPPRQSPAYGRGGDRALRAWAERYGYDVEFSIPPRHRPRR